MEILKVENLTKTYGKGDNLVRAVDNISFSIEKGEFVAITGSVGKTSTTEMIASIIREEKKVLSDTGNNNTRPLLSWLMLDIEDYEILQNFLSPEIITPQGKNFSTLADKDEIEAECGGTDLVHLGLDGDTETQAMVDECRKTIFEVLNTLTSRENEVIGLRFGLYCTKPKTLEEINEKFDVGRERIRQIEAKALRKLRHPSRAKKLKDFLTD